MNTALLGSMNFILNSRDKNKELNSKTKKQILVQLTKKIISWYSQLNSEDKEWYAIPDNLEQDKHISSTLNQLNKDYGIIFDLNSGKFSKK